MNQCFRNLLAVVSLLYILAAPLFAAPLLTEGSKWETFTVWQQPVLGTSTATKTANGYGWNFFTATAAPDNSWMQPEFAPKGWTLEAQPFGGGDMGRFINMANIDLRGSFFVADTAKVDTLNLKLGYRGGVVVYLNGKEIARKNLPEGELKTTTLAEDYPDEVYTGTGEKMARKADIILPVSELRKGTNILALGFYRSTFRTGISKSLRCTTVWVDSIEMSVSPDGVATTTPADLAPVRLNNASALAEVNETWVDEAGAKLTSIRLVTPRNGVASGQVVLLSTTPLTGVKAIVSALKSEIGTGDIPAKALQVRYGADTSSNVIKTTPIKTKFFDALREDAPAGGKVQPIWVTVNVPADIKPGSYTGTLTVTAPGLKENEVKVQLEVAPWDCPAPQKFSTYVELIQSPESVAATYGVPLWSEEHWALLEASFKLLGQVGVKDTYIPLITRTHHGNAQTMVRWTKNGDTYTPDFTVMDRYLDLWEKYVGTPENVVLYVWDYYLGGQGGSVGNVNRGAVMGKEVPVLVSLLDAKTGVISEGSIPPYGEPGSKEFWVPTIIAIRERLAKRGITDKGITLGVGADARPNLKQLAFWTDVAPYATWVLRSHSPTPDINGTPVSYASSPDVRGLGTPNIWKKPVTYTYTRLNFPRDYNRGDARIQFGNYSTPFSFRRVPQGTVLAMGANRSGIAGVGADFWPGGPGPKGWGHLGIHCAATYLFSPGPKGAISTVRFEMLR
ncbi:MAG: glycoside hydrolase domain-containing protein, partial [bacterium]